VRLERSALAIRHVGQLAAGGPDAGGASSDHRMLFQLTQVREAVDRSKVLLQTMAQLVLPFSFQPVTAYRT